MDERKDGWMDLEEGRDDLAIVERCSWTKVVDDSSSEFVFSVILSASMRVKTSEGFQLHNDKTYNDKVLLTRASVRVQKRT